MLLCDSPGRTTFKYWTYTEPSDYCEFRFVTVRANAVKTHKQATRVCYFFVVCLYVLCCDSIGVSAVTNLYTQKKKLTSEVKIETLMSNKQASSPNPATKSTPSNDIINNSFKLNHPLPSFPYDIGCVNKLYYLKWFLNKSGTEFYNPNATLIDTKMNKYNEIIHLSTWNDMRDASFQFAQNPFLLMTQFLVN